MLCTRFATIGLVRVSTEQNQGTWRRSARNVWIVWRFVPDGRWPTTAWAGPGARMRRSGSVYDSAQAREWKWEGPGLSVNPRLAAPERAPLQTGQLWRHPVPPRNRGLGTGCLWVVASIGRSGRARARAAARSQISADWQSRPRSRDAAPATTAWCRRAGSPRSSTTRNSRRRSTGGEWEVRSSS
jgi:hypothetical protein